MDFLESFKNNPAFDMPTLPSVTLKLISSLSDDKLSMEELSEVIALDPALATKTISMANSSFYSSVVANEIDSVHRAVTMLGIDSIRNFVFLLSLREGFKSAGENGFDLDVFWRKSITAAVAAQTLASDSTSKARHDSIFIVALLMNIGELVMQACEPELYRKALSISEETKCHIVTAERKVFDTDHQFVGSKVLKRWSLPESIYAPLEYHHNIRNCPTEHEATVRILTFCNRVSMLDFEGNKDESIEMLGTMVANQFNLNEFAADSYISEFMEARGQILSHFGGKIKTPSAPGSEAVPHHEETVEGDEAPQPEVKPVEKKVGLFSRIISWFTGK